MRSRISLGLFLAMIVGAGSGVAGAADKSLPTCPVTGEPINFAVSVPADEGPVFFCCKGCIKKYLAAPTKYAAAVALQRKELAKREKIQVTCPVTGEPVSDKVVAQFGDRKVHFCCKECIEKYKSSPLKYKKALANAYTYQTKCPVKGESIDPKAFSVLPTGETIYYCCKGCDKKLMAHLAEYAPKLAAQGVEINVAKVQQAVKKGQGQNKADHDHEHGH